MAKNDPAKKHSAETEEVIELTDEELEKLVQEPSPEVQQALDETRREIRKTKKTLGEYPDITFEKPLKETGIVPKGMYAVGGNEAGSAEGKLGNSDFYAVSDFGIDNVTRGPNRVNDDAFLADPDSRLLCVEDGLGGYAGGFIASSIGAYTALKMLAEKKGTVLPASVKDMLRKMHKNIRKFQISNVEFKKSSTTAVFGRQINTNKVEFAHAGDSGGMVIRGGSVVFRTKDDNYLHFLMDKEGIETEEEAKKEFSSSLFRKLRNSVTQALGVGYYDSDLKDYIEEIEPNYETFETQKGDVVLLFTDGLSDNLTDEEIAQKIDESLSAGKSIKEAIEILKEEAKAKMKTKEGKGDNITIGGYIVE